jgi:hypothetical protein
MAECNLDFGVSAIIQGGTIDGEGYCSPKVSPVRERGCPGWVEKAGKCNGFNQVPD